MRKWRVLAKQVTYIARSEKGRLYIPGDWGILASEYDAVDERDSQNMV